MKMIKPSLITKHSIECSQVKNEVKIMEQSSILNQIDYKIRKLKESLSQFKVNKEFDDDLFEALYKHCNDALIITSSTAIDILNCRRVISELDAIIKNFKGSFTVQIYMEKLIAIVKEKCQEIKKNYISTYEKVRISTETYNNGRQLNPFSQTEIDSSKEILLTPKVGYTTIKFETNRESKGSFSKCMNIKKFDYEKTHRDNMKRYFFTLIENNKKRLGRNSMAYYVENDILFNEVIKNKKPIEEWPNFISTELENHPENWIMPRKLSVIQIMYYMKII